MVDGLDPGAAESIMRIAVCVITYKRANGLSRLLEGIGALTFRGERPDILVVVVDNDEEGSGRKTCDAVRLNFAWDLEYSIEPRRGIPFARNTAVAHIGDDVDYVAFIDDDEVPDPRWLDELLRVMKKYQADVVAGPVLTHFMEEPPAWVIKGKFYDRPRRATGQVLDRAFTGNILFRRDVFRRMDALFDERMALTGGEDSHFLQRVNRAGFKIVWADEAIATEWQPVTRVNAKWILRRAFRMGTTATFIARNLRPAPGGALSTIPIGFYRIFKGLFFLPFGCLLGRRFMVTYVRHICYGAGMLAAWLNLTYKEYTRTHGS